MDARKLNSPEAQEVIRAADEAIMSRDALAGEIEQTVEDEKNAPSPGEALEAIERRRQLSAEYVVARQQAEEVLTWLREAVRNDSPERLNERMEEGRARNRENGKYDEKYDGISTRELSAERERLNLRIEQVENELEGAHGSRYRRLEREAERLYDERGAVEAEILLRGEVYGARPDGIGESAQVSDRPMAVVADDFGDADGQSRAMPAAQGGNGTAVIDSGDVQSVDNAGAANGYESSAIAQDAALRDYAPENGGAADAGQYGQVRTLGEAANALYQAVRDNENVTARGYNADNYGAQSEKVIRAARLNGGVVSLNAKEWAQVIGFDPANDTSTLRAWLNKALKRQVLDGIAQVNADGKVSSGDVLNFILGEQAYDAAHMAERSRFYNTLNSKSDMEIVNAAPVQYRQDDGRRVKSSELLQLIREKYSTGNMASFENADTGIAVDVRQDGLNETINRASKSDKQGMAAIYSSLYNIGDIIRTSVYVGSQTNYKNDGSSTEIHNFVAAVNIGGELYRAEFNVREIAGGKGTQEKFYFERLTKLDKKTVDARHGTQAASFDTPQRIGVAMQSTNDSIVGTNGNVNTISTNELLKGYNLNDKKMWPLSRVDSETNGGTEDASAAKMAQKRETSSGKRHLQGRRVTSETFSPSIDLSEEGLRQASDITSPRLTSATIFPSRPSDINISKGGSNVNADAGRVPGGIYANGKPLFSAMTDAELDGEIAREADGGRLAALRSERENRTGQESAERRARSARLDEIEGIIRDAPRAEDGELSRQERYLRRRTAQLDSEIEVARDSGDDVKGLTDELRRTQESLNAIHVEQQRRAQARREAGESLINEIRDANPGAGRTDAQQERERIRQSQRAGREALDALKAGRDGRRAWRTTDAISIEEAARVFTGGAGAEDGADMESALKANREAISQWEQRRAQLSGAEADLQEELSSLLKQQARMAQEDANRLSADDVRERLNINERIIRIQSDMDQVKGLRQQIDSSLRYLNAHAGEGVIETLRSGRIPEQMMERIMGYVDEIRVPKSGALGMNMNTPARVFDDLFGDAAPVMRAIYVDPIAEHEADRQRYIAGAREKIAALKLNSAESELVQRVGEGVMTADELDKAISEGLARRGSKLKRGDGTWQEGAEVSAPRVSTAEQAREALSRAVMNNPLQAGHEYKTGDYDELIKKVQADGGEHTGAEWEKILGFEGNNPLASNLERFVHNTQERTRNRSNGVNSQSSQEVVSASELLDFMRNEMANDAANMRLRQAQYERILAHENVPVHVLERTTLTTRDRYADAKGKAQFGDAVNGDTNVVVTLNKEGYSKTVDSIKKMSADVRPAALAALANYKTLIADGVYVGSYPDYGESAYIREMHCFVSAFEYGGEQYRAMYTAKESRNSDGTYSTKLYLQRVEALKAQKEQRRLKTSMASSQQGTNYNSTSAADTSITSPRSAVNTIDAKTLLEGYNLSALKAWPLAKIDVEERSAGDADSGWGRKADEVRRINHAVKVFNGIYEELYNMVNDAYVRNGYEKMGKRKSYFPHFRDDKAGMFEGIADKLGFGGRGYALPTSIDGLTESFSPGRSYNKHAQRRLGHDTAFDAVKGFEDYVDQATKAAYLTDDIKRLRQLEREIRAGEQIGTLTSRTKLSKANGDFGSLAKWVHEYANIVAGKKSTLDRGVENVVGRRVYQVLDTIRSRRGASAVAGNISSALTNIAPVVQVISEHPIATVKGMMGMMCDLMRGGDTPESRFLTRRFASDQLGVGRLARIEKIASKPFEIVDTIASNIVVRGYYQSNIDAGMEPEAAMLSADAQAARLMADRSLGQMPNVYSSKLFMGVLGQFQLEVANNLKWMKDITRTYSPGRAAAILTLLTVMSKLTNEAWKQLTGRDLMLDPITAGEAGISAGREAADEGGAWKGLWAGLSAAWGEISGNLPYISGGRIGTNLIGDAIDAVGTIKDAAEEGSSARAWDTAFWQMMNYITYGGQIKKSYQGEGALLAGGVYNKSGRLMYPVDASDAWTRVQTLIFGKSSTRYARMYYDEGRQALTADNTTKYQQLVEGGMSPGAAYETVRDG